MSGNINVTYNSIFINNVLIGSGSVDTSSVLTVNSTQKGLLLPRMNTSQKNAITSPSTGLIVFDTDLNTPNFYTSVWNNIGYLNVSSVSNTTFTIPLSVDTVVLTGNSTSFNVTLPNAIGSKGKVLRLLRTDTNLTNLITINTVNATQTIGSKLSVKLITANESWKLMSDGSNWQVLGHRAETDWVDTGNITIGITSGNTTIVVFPTAGTNVIRNYWKRSGQFIHGNMSLSKTSNTGANNGSGDYLFTLPAGLTHTADNYSGSWDTPTNGIYGHAQVIMQGFATFQGSIYPFNATTFRVAGFNTNGIAGPICATYAQITQSAVMVYRFQYTLPNTNWDT